MEKFAQGNEAFVDSKRISYRYMGLYHSGLGAMTTMVTIGVLVAGAVMMTNGRLELTDLITFLLYINNFTEPVKKADRLYRAVPERLHRLRAFPGDHECRSGYIGCAGCGEA